jgi:CRISPR-associated protein Cmr1
MKRELKEKAPVWEAQTTGETWTLTLTTITPMFGGSATAREVDPTHPIRPAAIRGHLRYWWRATTGAQFTTPEELYNAESALWGKPSNPNNKDEDPHGKVLIRVKLLSKGDEALLRTYLPEKPSPQFGPQAGYFVFPFNEDKQGNSISNGRKNIKFELQVQFLRQDATTSTNRGLTPEQVEEVRRTVQAWLLLGGVGARTRRGCGALRCEEKGWLPSSTNDTIFLQRLLGSVTAPQRFPSLYKTWIVLGNSERDAEVCWRRLGTFWHRLRKGHFTPKRPNYEPMSGCEWRDHATLKRDAQRNSIVLSKPYLGLPIIYQKFAGSFSGTLEAEQSGRMASPIILKPVAFADGTILPMVACLSAPEPEAIKIGSKVLALEVPADDPVLQELGAKHPLDAVRKAALKAGFQEVKL